MLEHLHPGSFVIIWGALTLTIISVLGLCSAPSAVAHLNPRWRGSVLLFAIMFFFAAAFLLFSSLNGRL